ncbi:MAG: 6-phosphofructokinase [Candidatus Sericytochromatia bacterium]|nr:6-phosphofructokinase [Candidatus Sericytochromatia bacterium]
MKRLAVLTSGGDAPGMNAAIRAAVRKALHAGLEVWGVEYGYNGLIKGHMKPLEYQDVGNILQRGGTVLKTARSTQFPTPEGQEMAMRELERRGIEGLVVIGGDGSFRGAQLLGKKGIAIAGVPGTIDNDIYGTDYTIGYDTAVNTVLDAINKIRDTASSHKRIVIIEVMGRDSGWIALSSGLAGGAEFVIVPEIPHDLDFVSDKIIRGMNQGKEHSIVIVAEGAAHGFDVGERLRISTGYDTRVTVLGHIQRGGSPTAFDRILATRLGAAAVDVLLEGTSNVMVGLTGNQISVQCLDDVIGHKKGLDVSLYELEAILASRAHPQ